MAHTDTCSPVVRYDFLRVFLAVVTQLEMDILQFDVKTAFLHGTLDEEISMEVPEGLEVSDRSDTVCLLKKSLYGLKQALRCWNDKFTRLFEQFDFKQCSSDPYIFLRQIDENTVYLALFVDDVLIASKDKTALETALNKLNSEFKITLGGGKNFVELQIKRDRINKVIYIHQEAYVLQILDRFRMSEAKLVTVSADVHTHLESTEGVNNCSFFPFRKVVGSLVFLLTVTRPDLAYAVNNVSRYLANPDENHWQAGKRIFRYLRGTTCFGIMYKAGGSESQLISFADVDYAGDVEMRRSTTGYVFYYANGAIT